MRNGKRKINENHNSSGESNEMYEWYLVLTGQLLASNQLLQANDYPNSSIRLFAAQPALHSSFFVQWEWMASEQGKYQSLPEQVLSF